MSHFASLKVFAPQVFHPSQEGRTRQGRAGDAAEA